MTDPINRIFHSTSSIDPDLDAVVEDTENGKLTVSFREFAETTRRFARLFRKASRADQRVAILLPRGATAYAAEMGALYAGQGFCPFESTNPTERINYCLKDLQPSLVLTDRDGFERIKSPSLNVIMVEDFDERLEPTPNYGNDAYVIYTSGSTGQPKGVSVSRRSMNMFLRWAWSFYAVSPADRWAQFSSLGFDLSLVDILTCLPSGGTIVPVKGSLDRLLPARFIERHHINVWHSVPSLIPLLIKENSLAEKQLLSLRIASFCGEPFQTHSAISLRSYAPRSKILNTYGPTEATFFCSTKVIDEDTINAAVSGSLPIGEPIPGWSFELRPHDEKVQELNIVSNYLSNGYISSTPDAKKFDVNDEGIPRYRTGDLVEVRDGSIYFVARSDNQVKIRGNRLDLSEIEYQALKMGVLEAKAFMSEGAPYLAVSLGSVAAEDLASSLKSRLPNYAQPARIIAMDQLPRNPNDKIDSTALQNILNSTAKDGHD